MAAAGRGRYRDEGSHSSQRGPNTASVLCAHRIPFLSARATPLAGDSWWQMPKNGGGAGAGDSARGGIPPGRRRPQKHKPEQGLLIPCLRDPKDASGHEAQKRQAGKETATTASQRLRLPVAPRRRRGFFPEPPSSPWASLAARARDDPDLCGTNLPHRHRPCHPPPSPAQIGVRKRRSGFPR